MKKVIVAGVVTPKGLGDALQYYITTKLLNDLLPEAEITLMCPDLINSLFVFENLSINAKLVDLNPAGYLAFRRLLRSSFPLKKHKSTSVKTEITKKRRMKSLRKYLKIIKVIRDTYKKYFTFYNADRFISSVFLRDCRFDAGMVGGHTLGDIIYRYITQYDVFNSVVSGPLVMSPISISKVGLEHFGRGGSIFKKALMVKRLSHSLQKLDFIYTRGPLSLEILRYYLNINEEKTGMALDSGFGARLLSNSFATSKTSARKKRRIIIVPRRDYFYVFNREKLYPLYLKSMTDFILWLSKNFDGEIFLSSQNLVSDAINDINRVLRKRGNNLLLKTLQIFVPTNLVDACKLYSSSDMVVTSRMHGGITALSFGVPVLFVLPSADTKLLDVLSFLGLDINSFLVDMFDVNSLKTENFVSKAENILENLDYYKKIVGFAVNKALPTLELPVKTLIKLSE